MHVDDVERLVVEGADRAQRRRRVGRERGDRAVGRRRQAVAERRHERLRRRSVARSEHARLVTLAAQLPGQSEHLRLDATRARVRLYGQTSPIRSDAAGVAHRRRRSSASTVAAGDGARDGRRQGPLGRADPIGPPVCHPRPVGQGRWPVGHGRRGSSAWSPPRASALPRRPHGARRDHDRRRGRRQRLRRARATTSSSRVRVTADELIDGRASTSPATTGRRSVVRQPLQVPAGTTKEVLARRARPVLRRGRCASTSATATGSSPPATSGCGPTDDVELRRRAPPPAWPAAASCPTQVTLASGTGRAELAPLTLDVLDLGPIGARGLRHHRRHRRRPRRRSTTSSATAVLLWVTPAVACCSTTPPARRPARRRGDPGRPATRGPGAARSASSTGRPPPGAGRRSSSRRARRRTRSTSASEMFVDPQQRSRRAGRRAAADARRRSIIALAVYGLVIGPVVYLAAAAGPPPDARLGRRSRSSPWSRPAASSSPAVATARAATRPRRRSSRRRRPAPSASPTR